MSAKRTDIGGRIIAARRERGWTQSELADRLGVHHSVVSRYETGHREIKEHMRQKMARVLGISETYLLTGNEGLDEMNRKLDEILEHIQRQTGAS